MSGQLAADAQAERKLPKRRKHRKAQSKMERDLYLTSEYIKTIKEAASKAEERCDRAKERMDKWQEEKAEWISERNSMIKRIGELELELKAAREGKECSKEEKIKMAENRLATEMSHVEALSEELWKNELKKRKACRRRVMISALEKGGTKEKVLNMLGSVLAGGVAEDKLTEQKGSDDWLRWFFECEKEEDGRRLLERGERLKAAWGMKVGEDRTFRERKKRQILDKKADLERAKNHAAKITVEGDWICVDGAWTCWLDREAMWMSENDWNHREKEREKKKLEMKLAQLNRELGKEEREGRAIDTKESKESAAEGNDASRCDEEGEAKLTE